MLMGDSLATRITAILLGSVFALALLVGVAVLWPKAHGSGEGLFQLPLPEETVAIVEALEASPPAARPLVLKALNTSTASVHLEPNFPPVPLGLRRAREMEWMFGHYSSILGGRPFRVDMRAGPFSAILPFGGDAARTSVRLSVGLRDGSVLVIDRRPSALIRNYIARAAIAAGAAALVLIAGLLLAIRQTARPVARLAFAARQFSIDGTAPDLPLNGPRELQDLSSAFNEMQHRIRGLVEDRTRVLAAIAHDLRTYLTRLRLRIDFIDAEDQRRKAVQDIEEMSLLLDDTLLFAQQVAKPDVEGGALDVMTELLAVVALRCEIGEDVTLENSDTTPSIFAQCSPTTFRRMLANLLDNAIRYGGAARIGLASTTDRVSVSVEDDGPGVPEDQLARLLKPFERMEDSRDRATGGAGLGLAIVKALAESVGGTLQIVNRVPVGLRAVIQLSVIAAVPTD